jgi:hypothetical protein
VLVLVYLRKGQTFAELAAGFGVGTTTAWRYAEEAVALLAARAPKPRKAVRDAKRAGHAYVVLDGTLIPVDRVAADRPFYSGKHRKHGMNLQVIASLGGDILWLSGALPGSVHDKKAEWIWGILAELEAAGLLVLADKGYQGTEHAIIPYKCSRPAPGTTPHQQSPLPGGWQGHCLVLGLASGERRVLTCQLLPGSKSPAPRNLALMRDLLKPIRERTSQSRRKRPTAPTRNSAHEASARTRSSRHGRSSPSSAAAPGAPGNSQRRSTYCSSAKANQVGISSLRF